MVNEHQKKLNEFGKKLNTASWYTGISAYQEKNIYELSCSLRDDYEQGSSFRVLKCLQAIGLKPLLSDKKIVTMVQMSRGNDLAFLFFLLEGVYKTPREHGQFSNNERLLMIAIAKLDLLPTLKELDRILPPPQYGSFEVQHKERQTEIELKELSLRLMNMKNYQPEEAEKKVTRKKANILPYFERQPRPKPIPLNLTSRPQDLVVQFSFWRHKDRPDYGRQTEAPWFTQYRLNPMSRLIRNMVSEVVDKYINIPELTTDRRSKNFTSLLEGIVDGKPSYCTYHKAVEESAQLLKDELTVKARDRCLQIYDFNMSREREAKRRKARIIAQLEHDIKECMERNAAMMKMELQKVHTLSQVDCVICKETHVPIPCLSGEKQQEGRALIGSCTKLAHTVVSQKDEKGRQMVNTFLDQVDFKDLTPEEPCPIKPPEPEGSVISKLSKKGGTIAEESSEKPEEGKAKGKGKRKKGGAIVEPPNCEPESSNLRRRLCPQSVSIADETCHGQNYRAILIGGGKLKPTQDPPIDAPPCNVILLKPQTRKSFFRATSNLGPYKFKYHRIFQTEPKPYDVKKHIAKTFVKALARPVEEKASLLQQQSSTRFRGHEAPRNTSQEEDNVDSSSDSSDTPDASSEHSQQSHIDYKANVIDAVVKCVKQIWKQKEAIKRAEMESSKKPSEPPAVLKYDITYFDPDDESLMDQLLFDGMKELQKDHRYVLASLPESHKMPALREWIKRRFGKSYTEKELSQEIDESQRIFEIVQTLQSNPPKADLMGLDTLPISKSNYSNYKEVQALGVKVRNAYCEKLNQVYMQQMNACWYAMGNYKNHGGPPRKIFYAYMSSNPNDIVRQHVWNGEFKNYKQLRDVTKKVS